MAKRKPTIEELRRKILEMQESKIAAGKDTHQAPRFNWLETGNATDDIPDGDDDAADGKNSIDTWPFKEMDAADIFDEDEADDVEGQWHALLSESPFEILDEMDAEMWFEDIEAFTKRIDSVKPRPIPPMLRDISRWIADNDLQHVADISIRELQRWQPFSITHCRHVDRLSEILNSPPGSLKHRYMQKNTRFIQAAHQYLQFWIQRKAGEARRLQQWETIDVSPSFNETVSHLRAFRQSLVEFPRAMEPVLHQKSNVLIPHGALGMGVEFIRNVHIRSTDENVRVGFHVLGDNRSGFSCNCGQLAYEPCAHIRVLVEWMLDVLADEQEPAHEPLRQRLSAPLWKLGLIQLQTNIQLLQTGSDTGLASASQHRLAWRINEKYLKRDGIFFEPIVQSPGANGKWTQGRRISEAQWQYDFAPLLEREHPQVTRYYQILKESDFAAPDTSDQKLADLLMSIADSPRIYLSGTKNNPIRVQVEKVVFAVAPCETGIQTTIRLGDLQLRGKEIVEHMLTQRHLYHLDAERGIFVIGEISRHTRPFAIFCLQNRSVLPSEAAPELFALLAEAVDVDVWVHPALRGKTVAPDMGIVARVVPEDEFDFQLSLHVYPVGDSVAYAPGAGPRELIRELDGTRVFVDRDLEGEMDAARVIAAKLSLPLDETMLAFCWHINVAERALEVLATLSGLNTVQVEWPEGATPLRVLRAGTPSLQVTARQKQDWFLIGGHVTVEDTEVSLKDLLAAVRKRQRFVRLKKGEFLVLQKDLYDRLTTIGSLDDGESGDGVSVPKSGIPFMDTQLADLSFHGGRGWNAVKARIAEAGALTPEVPQSFTGTLRPYQREGFEWLCRLSHWAGGACLADDMGLGKTLQALALLLVRNRQTPSLIVSPMSVCHNWIGEAATFAPSLDMRLYHGAFRETSLQQMTPDTVLVTSYDTLAANVDALTEIQFDLVVLDEAQMIKNALSKRARAVAGLQSAFRLALTGTPVENHLGDLWSIFHGAIPGLLGPYERFRRQYALPIERDANPRARELLKQLIRPFLLRRNKAEVLPDLPPRTETIAQVELDDRHLKLYNDERQQILDALLREDAAPNQKRFSALAGLTRLRRLACHPKLVNEHTALGSAKMERILEVIQDLVDQEQRALVFSQFTSHLALLQKELKRVGIAYLYLDGSTPQPVRKTLVDRWHEQQTPLFIISLKAGGFGLNLTGADYVLHLDPWWNPAAEDQATDRTHRIGQTKPVTVVRFIASDTVEQGVVALHEQKRELAESILDGSNSNQPLSPDELIALIRGE